MASLTGPLTLQTSADEVIEWRAFFAAMRISAFGTKRT